MHLKSVMLFFFLLLALSSQKICFSKTNREAEESIRNDFKKAREYEKQAIKFKKIAQCLRETLKYPTKTEAQFQQVLFERVLSLTGSLQKTEEIFLSTEMEDINFVRAEANKIIEDEVRRLKADCTKNVEVASMGQRDDGSR